MTSNRKVRRVSVQVVHPQVSVITHTDLNGVTPLLMWGTEVWLSLIPRSRDITVQCSADSAPKGVIAVGCGSLSLQMKSDLSAVRSTTILKTWQVPSIDTEVSLLVQRVERIES